MHAAFALHVALLVLHLAVLGKILYLAPRASGHLRGFIGWGAVFAFAMLHLAVYTLLGVACWSPSPSFVTRPLFLRFVQLLGTSLVASAVAAYFVVQRSKSAGRAAKLALLSTNALVAMGMLGWWWTHGPARALLAARVFTWVLLAASLVIMHSASKSGALTLVFFLSPAMISAVGALNALFPSDPDVMRCPELNPELMRSLLLATILYIIEAAISHATLLSYRPEKGSSQKASLAHHKRDVAVAAFPELQASEWAWLPLVLGMATLVHGSLRNPLVTFGELKIGQSKSLRELLSDDHIAAEQENSMPILLGAESAWLAGVGLGCSWSWHSLCVMQESGNGPETCNPIPSCAVQSSGM